MSKLATTAALLAFVCLFAAPAAAEEIVHQVDTPIEGTGNLLKSPVIYTGIFPIAGYVEGTWWFQIDDTGWPDPADPDARFDYIWAEYFADNYGEDHLGKKWQGDFENATFGQDITPCAGFPYGGHLGGSFRVTITIRDQDGDQVLDPVEKSANASMNGDSLHEADEGTGDFENLCGFGSMASTKFNFVYPPDDDELSFPGSGWYITTTTCQSPVEQTSWGAIKALFE
jgi:hypothetical protein